MDSLRFSRQRLALLIAVPLAWAVLLLFHPLGSREMYDELRDEVTRWQVVHVGTLFFVGLMGLAVYLLVRDLPGTAARVSRWASAVFVLSTEPGKRSPASPWEPSFNNRTAFPALSSRLDPTRSRASTTTPSSATSASSGVSVRWPGSRR
jgi:hypothetical protein